MALTISYRAATTLPVDLRGLTPDWAREKSLPEICKSEVLYGRNSVALGELFEVEGDPHDGLLEFRGDFSHARNIGCGMTAGTLTVVGSAGSYVGLQMRGGEIHIAGNVGDFLGSEMHHGIIRVDGSAGDAVGAGRYGTKRGMTGGIILVAGDVGNLVGERMRRGLIAIGGKAGELLGHSMLAGSIVVLGTCGQRAGAGMKRGTLCLVGGTESPILPSFRRAGTCKTPALLLLGRHLESLGFVDGFTRFVESFEMLHGDFLALGKGELLLRN